VLFGGLFQRSGRTRDPHCQDPDADGYSYTRIKCWQAFNPDRRILMVTAWATPATLPSSQSGSGRRGRRRAWVISAMGARATRTRPLPASAAVTCRMMMCMETAFLAAWTTARPFPNRDQLDSTRKRYRRRVRCSFCCRRCAEIPRRCGRVPDSTESDRAGSFRMPNGEPASADLHLHESHYACGRRAGR
jgi:hypothetical protein